MRIVLIIIAGISWGKFAYIALQHQLEVDSIQTPLLWTILAMSW